MYVCIYIYIHKLIYIYIYIYIYIIIHLMLRTIDMIGEACDWEGDLYYSLFRVISFRFLLFVFLLLFLSFLSFINLLLFRFLVIYIFAYLLSSVPFVLHFMSFDLFSYVLVHTDNNTHYIHS